MKKAIVGCLLVLALAGCAESRDPVNEIEQQAKLADICHEAGGEYVYAMWPGYTAASYRCIWDGLTEW